MKEIPLTKGKVALVDDEDYEYLSQWKWCYNVNGYAIRRVRKGEDGWPRRIVYMHRVIAKAREDEEVDHRHRNTLDNRRSELRLCDSFQNKWNSKVRKTNKLGLKGVYRHQGGFRARIKVYGKSICLGVHPTPEQAHAAYAMAAKEYFGEFSRS
jgi:hypothetical protein